MISRRVIINLSAFLAVAVVLIFFGVVNLLGNPLARRTGFQAVFPDASGLSPNFDVTYDGVAVGSVDSVSLGPKGAVVKMSLDPGQSVPDDVVASVDLENALGEQQVDLTPARSGSAPPLRSGANIGVNPNGVPASVGELVAVATKLLDAIPPGDLNTVLQQLAVALNGRGQDLRTITQESDVFAREFLQYQDQFKALLTNAPPVLDAVADEGPQLQQALANTAVLLKVLAADRGDVANLITRGAVVTGDLQNVVGAELPNLACLTHDLSDLTANLDQPVNLSDLNTTLLTNTWFFGAVEAVSPTGAATSLYAGDPARNTQEWLRTRLLLPPAQPTASQYSAPRSLPPTKPGAGCSTEFGSGVGPATQANASPPGPGGYLDPPTPAEAVVRGGPVSPTGEAAVYSRPLAANGAGAGAGAREWAWPGALGLAVTVGGWWLLGLSVPRDPAGRGRRSIWRR